MKKQIKEEIEVVIVPLTSTEKACLEQGRKQILEKELKFLEEILNMFLLGFDKDIKTSLEKRIAQIKKEMEK